MDPDDKGEYIPRLPRFKEYKGSNADNRITRHHQAIITSYQFDCGNRICGNITEWGVDVERDSGMEQPGEMPYTLDLQVWRPSPTVDDSTGTGCYSLVGNNRFTSISLNGGVAVVTPSPQDYIQFQPGDVLGFYVEEARDTDNGVVILTSYEGITSFTSELVWHASIAPSMATSQNGDCPYSVGSNGGVLNTLTRAAPVISIATGKIYYDSIYTKLRIDSVCAVTFPCPSSPSMATIQPTPHDQPLNSTTDSEEALPITNQQTLEPVDPSNRSTTDPEGTVTELTVPTTSEVATDPRPILRPSESTDIGLIIGIVAIIIIVVILSMITVVVIIAALFKKCHGKFTITAVPTTANQAYGLEETIYNDLSPEVDMDNTIEAKQNEAYVTNTDVTVEENQAYGANIDGIIMEGNKAYATCANIDMIATEGNQAYAMNIITEESQAYATSTTTEENGAYEPVITDEAVVEYNYVYN